MATAWSAIALMRDPTIAPDRKTPVLHELVTIVRTHSRKDAALAWTIILIALWPGLDAMYRRHRRMDDEPDLGPLIVGHFADAVRRLNLRQVAALAATLILNTERHLIYQRRRARQVCLRERDFATMLSTNSNASVAPDADLPRTPVARLAIGHLGADTKHLLELVASGRPAREISGLLDCSESAIWKRVERARAAIEAGPTAIAKGSARTGTCR